MSKILIIEDDRDIAAALSTRLRAAGFTTVNAYDGLTGVSHAATDVPDLIILDLMMPAAGGVQVAEGLRALSTTATVPIIFMTASRDPELRAQAMAVRPHAFIEKPYDPAVLLERVQEALGEQTVDSLSAGPRTDEPAHP